MFLGKLGAQLGRSRTVELSEEAEDLLVSYSWPGNIRELRNTIERALVLCGEGPIEIEHLPVETMTTNSPLLPVDGAMRSLSQPGAGAPSESERERILRVLNECAGNQSRAAKVLGISRSTFVQRLNAYQVPRPRRPAS
jgi:DNA-binding NtrC family response regulator